MNTYAHLWWHLAHLGKKKIV